MNQIGLLFKELNNNNKITSILQELETNPSIEMKDQVLENIYSNQEIMTKLNEFVVDTVNGDIIIKQKIIVFVNQALIKYLKNKEKILEKIYNKIESNNELIENINEPIIINQITNDYKNNKYLNKYNIDDDKNNKKVIWIAPYIRLETFDHLIKMTTPDYELYY